MSNTPKIQCPKCLQNIAVSSEQAGARINCPHCGAVLIVPETIAVDNVFDDLFNEPISEDTRFDADDDSGEDVFEEYVEPEADPQNIDGEGDLPDDSDDDLVEASDLSEDQSTTKGDQATFDTGWIDDLKAISEAASRADDESSEGTAGVHPRASDTIENTNPFEYDETRSLRIDGISPDVVHTEGFYVKCSVCDSELHATEAQIGQLVQCTDCLSEIRIEKPKKKRKVKDDWRRPAELKKVEDSNDELQLEPPIERPKQYEVPADFGLDEVADNLLEPIVEPEEIEIEPINESSKRQANIDARRRKHANKTDRGKPSSSPGNQGGGGKTTRQAQNRGQANVKRKTRRIEQATEAKPIEFSQIKQLELYRDIDLIIRSVVVIIFLSFGYLMADSMWATFFHPDLNGGEKFTRILPAAIGFFVCMCVSGWFLSITLSVLMRAVANGFTKVEEWIGFSPSEWMGYFAAVAFAAWAAALPGALFGYFLYKLLTFIFLPMSMAASCFLLLPIFLVCSFYNESVFNIFSAPIMNSIGDRSDLWVGAYKYFAICLGVFLFGTIVLLIPGMFGCILGATIQVAAVTLFAVLLGLHARGVVATVG